MIFLILFPWQNGHAPELKIRRKSVGEKFCSSLSTSDESAKSSSPVKEQTEEVLGLEIVARCTLEGDEKSVRSTRDAAEKSVRSTRDAAEKSVRFISLQMSRWTVTKGKSLDDLQEFRKCLMCNKSLKVAKFEVHLRNQHSVNIKFDKHFLDSNRLKQDKESITQWVLEFF